MTLPILNKVIIKCTVHCIVHLQCILSLVRIKVGDSDVLAWVRGQRKTSQVMGAFGLLDFNKLRPVLAWRKFWKLWTIYFFKFPIFFGPQSTADNWNCGYWISWYGGTTVTSVREVNLIVCLIWEIQINVTGMNYVLIPQETDVLSALNFVLLKLYIESKG
jgi:hypothetical protein